MSAPKQSAGRLGDTTLPKMHDLEFSSAAARKLSPSRVLRLWMRPYSVGHEILLCSQGNPLAGPYSDFVKLKPQEQRAAVVRAALICNRSWHENQLPHRWLRLWGWSIRKENYSLAITDFLNYRAEGSTYPPAPSKESEKMAGQKADDGPPARTLGAPLNAALYQFLCGLPDREIANWGETAWDFPYGLGCFLYFTQLEMDGARKIENADERYTREFVAKAEAEAWANAGRTSDQPPAPK